MSKIMGIYGILNNINFKIYIGSSKDIKSRKQKHLYHLIKGNHHNKHLQLAFNKYGRSSFSFIIFEKNVEVNNLAGRELHWINLKNSFDRNFGYNIEKPIKFQEEYIHKESSKELIGYKTWIIRNPNKTIEEYKIWKEQKEIKESKIKRLNKEDLALYQIDKLTGTIIKEHLTSGEAAKDLNLSIKKIQDVLRGDRASHKGFVFVYKKNYNSNNQYVITKEISSQKRIKPLYQYDTQKNLIKKWDNIHEVISELSYSQKSIETALCRNKSYKGFYWSRK